MKAKTTKAHGLFLACLFLSLTITTAGVQNKRDRVETGAKTNHIMEQRLSFITIGAKDLNKLKQFYIDKFQWSPMKDDQGIVFFKMNGLILALFPTNELAEDAKVKNDGNGFKGFTLAINYRSEAEVDEVFSGLKSRGVPIVKPPQKVFWGGYSGYVADVEGNLWEIAYNPFLEMDKERNIVTHQ